MGNSKILSRREYLIKGLEKRKIELGDRLLSYTL